MDWKCGPAALVYIVCCVLWCGVQADHAAAAGSMYELELVHRQKDIVLRRFPLPPGAEFTLSYTHSSDHTPVVDRFQITGQGDIVLLEERFAWYGSGLAFHPRENIDLSRGWTRTYLHRNMDPFYLRIGRVAGHTLGIGDRRIALQDIAPGGTCLWIRVRAKGESTSD